MNIRAMASKVPGLIRTAFEWARHGRRFGYYGYGARIGRSVRVDGPESIELGRRATIQDRSWLYAVGIEGVMPRLVIGEGCALGYGNHIVCVREITIGDHVLTANNVYISDNYHGYEDISIPIRYQAMQFKGPVRIGTGSWIGENACVIGASIGMHCIIGANAVVTHDVPDCSIAVGAPARVIKRHDPATSRWINANN